MTVWKRERVNAIIIKTTSNNEAEQRFQPKSQYDLSHDNYSKLFFSLQSEKGIQLYDGVENTEMNSSPLNLNTLKNNKKQSNSKKREWNVIIVLSTPGNFISNIFTLSGCKRLISIAIAYLSAT